MPFLTRNPNYYLSQLNENRTDPLHIGLLFEEGAGDEQSSEEWVELANAIKHTCRSIRCLWLRLKSTRQEEDDESNKDPALSAFYTFTSGLTSCTSIESLVLEDSGIDINQLRCLHDFIPSLRGIKFLRTRLDSQSSTLFTSFFVNNPSLRVLDLSYNPLVDDDTVRGILDALLKNKRCLLETLNIFERIEEEEDVGDEVGLSQSCVDYICAFVSKTPSLSVLRLKIRELNDEGIAQLANVLKEESCNITRLEISGQFGDIGVTRIAESLATNKSLRNMDIGVSLHLTDIGGRALLNAVQGKDNSWQSIISSNHVLQNVYISDKAAGMLSNSIISQLQSITAVEPQRTIQSKAWTFIDNNIRDLSSVSLDTKLRPYLLAFVSSRGGVNSLFSLLSSRKNEPHLYTSHPTPEKIRMLRKLKKVKKENEVLAAMLRSERRYRQERKKQLSQSTLASESTSIHASQLHVRELDDDEYENKNDMTRCLLLPLFKAFEICKSLIEMIKESPTSSNSAGISWG